MSKRTRCRQMTIMVSPRIAATAVAAILVGCGAPAADADEQHADHLLQKIRLFEADSTLHDVRGLAITADRSVWAIAGMEPFLHVYSPRGELTGTLGRKGRGPGELLNPWSIARAGPDGSAVRIWDTATRRLTTFSLAGEASEGPQVRTAAAAVRGDIRRVSYGEPQRMDRLGDGYVVQDDAGGISQTVDFWSSRLLRVSASGAVVATIVDFREFLAGGTPQGRASVFVPVPLWATCSGETLAVLDPIGHQVRWYDAEGEVVGQQRYLPERRSITRNDIQRYVRHTVELELRDQNVAARQITRLVAQVVSERRSNFGTEVPPAVAMLCDPVGRVWLNRFSTARNPLGYGSDWRVVDGTPKATVVRFPPGFRPSLVEQDGAYGIHEDELGVQTVAFVPFPREFLPLRR